VELAKQFKVPLRVLNSLQATSEGTVVKENGMEEFAVTGVTAAKDKCFLEVDLARTTVLGALWESAAQTHLSVVAPVFSAGKVQFFIDRDAQGEWKKLLDRLSVEGFVQKFELQGELVPVSVVGDRFSQDGAALCQVIETLARQHVSVTIGSASALAITVAVGRPHVDDAVRALHQEFFKREA
jgi:aspartate kinase